MGVGDGVGVGVGVGAEVTTWVTVPLLPWSVAVPLKVAVMEWLPTVRDDVLRIAVPSVATGAVPSVVGPSLNVTVPVVTGNPSDATEALSSTVSPTTEGLGPESNAVVVTIGRTTWSRVSLLD